MALAKSTTQKYTEQKDFKVKKGWGNGHSGEACGL